MAPHCRSQLRLQVRLCGLLSSRGSTAMSHISVLSRSRHSNTLPLASCPTQCRASTLQIMPPRPLLQYRFRRISDQNMHMIHTSHALQTNPILEPQYPLLRILPRLPRTHQFLHEIPLHKVFYNFPARFCDISSFLIRCDRCFAPD